MQKLLDVVEQKIKLLASLEGVIVRVSEVYTSIQGEGPNVGKPTVFVRFGGCNLKCSGWPCDTPHAIDASKFRQEWKSMTPKELSDLVIEHLKLAGCNLVTLTGGEPFLQKHSELELFINYLPDTIQIEAFTNGTIMYPEWAVNNISMIMDWKLPGSNEDSLNQVRIDNLTTFERVWNSSIFGRKQAIKFVCKDMYDLSYAHSLWSVHCEDRPSSSLEIFYGKVWDSDQITNAEMCEYVLTHKLPWRLNVQLHNYIWDAKERGR
jgi:7-carboxy-7-deazaguanine synthase